MDLLANNVALKSKVKKEKNKTRKNKLEKTSSIKKCVKSHERITKNKTLKTDKLKSKKKILKENLENVDSGKVNTKINKAQKNLLKNKEVKESKDDISKVSEQIPVRVKKQKSDKVKGIKTEKRKRKNDETDTVSQKSKKIKKEKGDSSEDNKSSSDVVPDIQLSLKQVASGVEALMKLANEESKSEKSLMTDEKSPILLQVCCIKIPKTPSRQLRILLPHSLVSSDDDVALIVRDLKKGRRTDYEPTVDHFQQLLNQHKCSQIKTIIPFNQLKTEYDQFELKRNLVNSYDFFLIDGRISGHVAGILGKTFSRRRKLPTSIRMGSKDLEHEISHALNKTCMPINSNGDTQTVQIGTTSMSEDQIIENIDATCKNLAKNYPGGWANIRALRIKTQRGLGIPIYMTLKCKNKVQTPNVKPKRPKAFKTYEGELTTLSSNAFVTVTPDGTVTVRKEKK